jgi:hypothetical protein
VLFITPCRVISVSQGFEGFFLGLIVYFQACPITYAILHALFYLPHCLSSCDFINCLVLSSICYWFGFVSLLVCQGFGRLCCSVFRVTGLSSGGCWGNSGEKVCHILYIEKFQEMCTDKGANIKEAFAFVLSMCGFTALPGSQ